VVRIIKVNLIIKIANFHKNSNMFILIHSEPQSLLISVLLTRPSTG
jgi:hypothetical protein